MIASRRRLLLVSFALLGVAWLALALISGGDAGLLSFGPVLLLAAPLAGGRYVGEERLLALVHRRAARRPRRRSTMVVPRGRVRVTEPGGRYVARVLAQRPPPHAALGLIT
jgi:hypothetical protein